MSRSGYVNDQQERGRLYFTVGVPAAGKSTVCNDFVKNPPLASSIPSEFPELDYVHVERPRVVIAGDDFRVATLGREYVPSSEHLIFSLMDTAVAALLHRGFDVLIDETSTSRPTLMRYLRLDPNASPIFLDTPREECERRAVAAGRPYLLPVIERLWPRFEKLRANWPTIRKELLEQVEHRLSTEVTV